MDRRVQAAARPALHLIHSTKPSRSRFGGLPDLPNVAAWPKARNAPLAFIGQLDLAELNAASLPGFPPSGLLSIFYDQERGAWGSDAEDADSWRILYHDTDVQLTPTAPPQGADTKLTGPQISLIARRFTSLPDPDRVLAEGEAGRQADIEDILERTEAAFNDQPKHQLGGFARAIQSDDMEADCERLTRKAGRPVGSDAEWTLLLQIDSDGPAAFEWCDAGILYFWIRRHDLERRDFSAIWMILQSH